MKKILVVDDNPDIVDLLSNRLEANNYQVVSAEDGEKAVKAAQQHKPDLVIMDLMMPKLAGGDAVRILKSDNATKHIPVMFLTAVTAGLQHGDDVGINVDGQFYPAVSKPFDSAKLLLRIKKVLGDG